MQGLSCRAACPQAAADPPAAAQQPPPQNTSIHSSERSTGVARLGPPGLRLRLTAVLRAGQLPRQLRAPCQRERHPRTRVCSTWRPQPSRVCPTSSPVAKKETRASRMKRIHIHLILTLVTLHTSSKQIGNSGGFVSLRERCDSHCSILLSRQPVQKPRPTRADMEGISPCCRAHDVRLYVPHCAVQITAFAHIKDIVP